MQYSRTMRIAGMVLVMCLGLSACGGDAEPAREAQEPTAAPTLEEAATLAETCPEIEKSLPNGSLLPSPKEWTPFLDRLESLSEGGDTETKNAIAILTPAVEGMAARWEDLTDKLAAQRAFLAALDSLGDRCATVGSSALQ